MKDIIINSILVVLNLVSAVLNIGYGYNNTVLLNLIIGCGNMFAAGALLDRLVIDCVKFCEELKKENDKNESI